MNLRARRYVESQKQEAAAMLAARLAFLKEKGLDPAKIRRDASIRKIKAMVRKANLRLAAIAAQEKQSRDLAQAKADKLAAEKAAREAPPEKPVEAAPEKKEKKGKKEKKEKAKPEKQEKQEKQEKKKAKEEKAPKEPE